MEVCMQHVILETGWKMAVLCLLPCLFVSLHQCLGSNTCSKCFSLLSRPALCTPWWCPLLLAATGPKGFPNVTLYIPGTEDFDLCVNAVLVREKVALSTGPLWVFPWLSKNATLPTFCNVPEVSEFIWLLWLWDFCLLSQFKIVRGEARELDERFLWPRFCHKERGELSAAIARGLCLTGSDSVFAR